MSAICVCRKPIIVRSDDPTKDPICDRCGCWWIPKYGSCDPDAPESPEPKPNPNQRIVGPKVGRNDPCPCGSGSKFKRCCGG